MSQDPILTCVRCKQLSLSGTGLCGTCMAMARQETREVRVNPTPEQRAELEAALANQKPGSPKIMRERFYVFQGYAADVWKHQEGRVSWRLLGILDDRQHAAEYVRLSLLAAGGAGTYHVERRMEEVP